MGRDKRARYGEDDRVIRPGDLIHCDVGLQYLRFDSDHQQLAYVLQPGESEAPYGLRELFAEQAASGHLHGRIPRRIDGE